jgi:uncharacterized protein
MLLALCSTMLLGALIAPLASAHVTANTSAPPTKGGYAKIDIRVPTERDDPTTAVTVQMPEGTTSVGVQPVPGWSYSLKQRTLDTPIKGEDGDITEVVESVTWSGGKILAGEFQQFPISIKLPEKGEVGDLLFFPAVQTYADGTVVKWNAKPASASDTGELEHPAPKLTLVAAAEGGGHGAPAAVKEVTTSGAAAVDTEDAASTSGVIALVLAGLALLLALGAFVRSGRRSS